MVDRRHGEFGAGPGAPARRPDGSRKDLNNREQYRLTKQSAMADKDFSAADVDSPELALLKEERALDVFHGLENTLVTPAEARKAERARLKARQNGYGPEGVDPGEQIA